MASLHEATTAAVAHTINEPLDPPDAQGDDEAHCIPRAAWPIGYRGGHHWGEGQDNDGTVKHLKDKV